MYTVERAVSHELFSFVTASASLLFCPFPSPLPQRVLSRRRRLRRLPRELHSFTCHFAHVPARTFFIVDLECISSIIKHSRAKNI